MFSQFRSLIKNNKNQLSLYIHWPYCESKCPYCDFNSHLNEKVDVKQWIKSYKNQLYGMKDQLIKKNVNSKNLSSVFFGGGTPSLMPLEIIESILEIASEIYGFKNDIEITLEANPSSSDSEKLHKLKKLGINRLSIGVQSLNNENLKYLGRIHNVKDVEIALSDASRIFDNISIDLIYALHGQKLVSWINELETLLKTNNLQHISLYQLTIEEGTKFFKDHKNGHMKLIDNDLAAEFYNESSKILNDFKFIRYEVSNYAKQGYECKHNLNYWNSDNWMGIGPGAYGRLWSLDKNKCRIEYQNYKNPKTWLLKNMAQSNFEKIKKLSCDVYDVDTLMMGLRLYEGFEISKLKNKMIINFDSLKELEEKKIISFKKNILKVNENHMIKLNSIIDFLIYS